MNLLGENWASEELQGKWQVETDCVDCVCECDSVRGESVPRIRPHPADLCLAKTELGGGGGGDTTETGYAKEGNNKLTAGKKSKQKKGGGKADRQRKKERLKAGESRERERERGII